MLVYQSEFCNLPRPYPRYLVLHAGGQVGVAQEAETGFGFQNVIMGWNLALEADKHVSAYRISLGPFSDIDALADWYRRLHPSNADIPR